MQPGRMAAGRRLGHQRLASQKHDNKSRDMRGGHRESTKIPTKIISSASYSEMGLASAPPNAERNETRTHPI